MLVSSSTSQPLQPLIAVPTSASGSEQSLTHADATQTFANPSSAPPSESKETVEGERVTLTATREASANVPELLPIYAEIWKDGRKVAEIDIHGGVSSTDGLVASTQGTVGNGGPLLAARRAAEIVRAIGGELRVGGQVMDGQTLDMRAKLKMAYGA